MSKFEEYINEVKIWSNPMFKNISKNWDISPEQATLEYGRCQKQAEKEGKGEKASYIFDLFNKKLKEKYKPIKESLSESLRDTVSNIRGLDINKSNTRSHKDDEDAKKNGVVLYPIFYNNGEKTGQVMAVDQKTNKILRTGTIEWVKSQLEQYELPLKKDLPTGFN